MPFSLPSIPSPVQDVPPPPPAIGATGNAAVNIGIGSAVATGSNAFTLNQYGQDVAGVAVGTNLIFQFVKHFKFNQHFWWPVALIVIALALFIGLEHDNIHDAIPKALQAAWQAAVNFHSLKIAGVNVLPSAPDP